MSYSMTWADFYLICFAVGFCFSFFSFVFGGARTGRLHLPHFHGHGGHMPVSAPAHLPVGAGHVSAEGNARGGGQGGVSPFNFVTFTAFLAWFGGTGYLLTRYSGLWVGFGLLASMIFGLVGGATVFLFLSRSFDLGRGEHGPCGLRNGWCIGKNFQFHPRRRNGRDGLRADGHAASVRGTLRRPQRHRQGDGGGGDPV